MATDREVEHIELDVHAAVSPHLGADAGLLLVQCFLEDSLHAPLLGIAHVQRRNRLGVQQGDTRIVAAHHTIGSQNIREIPQQRFHDVKAVRQDITLGAARRYPWSSLASVWLARMEIHVRGLTAFA